MMTFQPGEIVKAGHFGVTLSNKGQEKIELQRGELMTILKISWYGDHVKVRTFDKRSRLDSYQRL